jgi:hypothetical protein
MEIGKVTRVLGRVGPAGSILAVLGAGLAHAEAPDAGSTPCAAFTAAVQLAATDSGRTLDPFREYLLGFEKGYAWQAPAPFDVFATLGEPPIDRALAAIATWCAGSADGTFADGLKAVVRRQRSAAPAH